MHVQYSERYCAFLRCCKLLGLGLRLRLKISKVPTLATHLRHVFSEQLQRFVCIVDHANKHTSHRGLVLDGIFLRCTTGATNDSPRW